ncbi:serine hydrolase [Kushneria indalinina]|uniref:Beta-lactamase class A n=1 Tax=Kushneria indalinina DSM 14324 TaxID=1122140 RepID=A0A3D9DXH3_9GAMM|nr:serine hydrolase [Kushneria indalinina]REC95478.1 beta-lactamase class A [Kushneria indalinina DSM 14324]
MTRFLSARTGSFVTAGLLVLSSAALYAEDTRPEENWVKTLGERITTLDNEAEGTLGVHVHRLADDTSLDHKSDRLWYLSSAVKVPVAIVLLQQVEAGERSLDDELTLEASQRIDGAGELLWVEPGQAYSLDNLLERMLIDSDNVATDMLIEAIGVDTLNGQLQQMTRQGFFGSSDFEPLTTLAEVRYSVYGDIHPDARTLDREQLVEIASAPIGDERVAALARTLDVDREALNTDDMTTAFDRYYDTRVNSATLKGYADLLTALVRGELINEEHRELLFDNLKIDRYDGYRLEGGLPQDVSFIQKTGTQHQRACHMGVIRPDEPDNAIVIAACIEDMDEGAPAEALFKQIGEAITETMLAPDDDDDEDTAA